jgi:hypothetical protein
MAHGKNVGGGGGRSKKTPRPRPSVAQFPGKHFQFWKKNGVSTGLPRMVLIPTLPPPIATDSHYHSQAMGTIKPA